MTSYVWILLFGALLVITKAQELDLSHALDDFDEKPTPKPAPIPPKQGEGAPIPPKQGDGGFDLSDAVPDPNHPKPEATKKPVVPVQDGGDLSDSDLFNVGNDGYKPDPGRGGRSEGDISVVTDDRDDNTKAAEGGQMAGIISAVAVAIFGAASSYFAYQKKKLCFKVQGGADPESGGNQPGTQSDPQASRNLLRIS